MAEPSPWGPDGDQLNRPVSMLAHPRDGTAEKQFIGLAVNTKNHDFLPL